MLRLRLWLPAHWMQWLLFCSDFILIPFSLWLAFSLRLGQWYLPPENQWLLFISAPLVTIPVFIRLGLYRAVVRYLGHRTIWAVFKAVSFTILLWASLAFLTGMLSTVPRSVMLIHWLVTLLFIGGSRLVMRSLVCMPRRLVPRVLIYGAGEAGNQLAAALRYGVELIPVAFIDDDPKKQRYEVSGLRVYSPEQVGLLIEQYHVKEILLAMPSMSRTRKRKLLTKLELLQVHVRSLPSLNDLAKGKVGPDDLRDVDINDILGRDPVKPIDILMERNIRNKSVMVTGAGGSIGMELCRQIAKHGPKRIILFEQSEYALYQIDLELTEAISNTLEIISLLGSVLDEPLMKRVIRDYGVQTIYHAAAYKHVPMVEKNVTVALKNNVFGTLTVAQAALAANIETFVLISTDKAVRSTNVMGASKRLAECIIQGLQQVVDGKESHANTLFTAVRFGNVLDSSGSVVPRFRNQISEGGPVTVTDPEITRYFMTITEAVELVIQAGAMGKGGDVFVLEMGGAININKLANKMIRLSGLTVKDELDDEGDIEIQFTGLRPGEKLHEELFIDDNAESTAHPCVLREKNSCLPWDEMCARLKALKLSLEQFDEQLAIQLLKDFVGGHERLARTVKVNERDNDAVIHSVKSEVDSSDLIH